MDKNKEGYSKRTNSKRENTIDVVVQHMKAAKFTDEEIMHMLNVTKEFITKVCTQTSK